MAKPLDSDTKGGGQRGPPKRWTGGGPRPARHIPWPELIKHHQSVLTGHLKMMDMVRKHCVQGTGNHDTAKACVDRTHEMMRMFKQATMNFVPPKDNIDRVPLGASSASMYPGYSPADHIYGEAAQEYGERAAELKRKGMDLKLDPDGPQYVVGHEKRPRRLSQEPEQTQPASISSAGAQNVSREDEEGEPMEGIEQSTDAEQYFVIDSKPTPIIDPGEIQKQKNKANDKAKRRVSFKEEQDVGSASINNPDIPKTKKAKVSATEPPAVVNCGSSVQEEDLSEEVDARLKAKEEKRRRKQEKKRKRDSGDSLEIGQEHASSELAYGRVDTSLVGKPRKKLHKKDQNEISGAAEPSAEASDDKESKKDRKKKKKVGADEEEDAAATGGDGKEKPKKRRKKETASSN